MSSERLWLQNILVQARDGSATRTLLDIPRLEIPAGTRLGVRGASGAGKTTLLRVLCGLLPPDAGCVYWGERDIARLPEAARDTWRGTRVGFVFQDFRLFPALSALDNVLVPATFRCLRTPAHVRSHALDLLESLDMAHPHQRADALSRGEQQRVAVARALLFRPGLLLADEPTASLDATNARVVMDRLLAYACKENATLCVVSHDPLVLDRLPQRLGLERGKLEAA